MPWVLWDIVVPLLITFLVGLATGWLLWRWRRYKQPAAGHLAAQQLTEAQARDSAAVLIEERDAALERAEQAEAKVHELTAHDADSETTAEASELSNATLLHDEADSDAVLSVTADTVANDDGAEIAAAQQELAKEKAAKAELEQAFMDLNNRYKNLNQQLQGAMDENNAVVVRDAASLQSQYDSAQQQLAEQKQKNSEQEQRWKAELSQRESEAAEFNRKLAEKESEILRLEADKARIESQLSASGSANGNDHTAAATQGGKVHHLSSYSQAHKKPEGVPAGDNMAAERSDTATGSNPLVTAEATNRPAGGVGLNTAHAVQQVDAIEDDESADALAEDLSQGQQAEPIAPASQSQQSDAAEDTPQQAATSSKKPAARKATASGYTPEAWSVPEITPKKAERDDLQAIKGVGPVLEKLLHKTGIYYFKQVALLDKKGVAELDSQLPQFSGRIQRDKWVQQARSLHRAKYGEAAK